MKMTQRAKLLELLLAPPSPPDITERLLEASHRMMQDNLVDPVLFQLRSRGCSRFDVSRRAPRENTRSSMSALPFWTKHHHQHLRRTRSLTQLGRREHCPPPLRPIDCVRREKKPLYLPPPPSDRRQ